MITERDLLKNGFKFSWESQGQRCFSKRCSKRVNMFFVFDADESVVRAGVSTNEGAMFPVDTRAELHDVLSAVKIFRLS